MVQPVPDVVDVFHHPQRATPEVGILIQNDLQAFVDLERGDVVVPALVGKISDAFRGANRSPFQSRSSYTQTSSRADAEFQNDPRINATPSIIALTVNLDDLFISNLLFMCYRRDSRLVICLLSGRKGPQ